jgi:CRP-like cAMP-binding protein
MDGSLPSVDGDGTGNRLLDALADEDRLRFLAKSQRVRMPVGEVAFHPGEDIRAVHFPMRGVLSLVTTTRSGSTIEVSTLGNEGTTGVPIFLGAKSQKNVRCISQVEGEAWRIAANDFRDECETNDRLHTLMSHYTSALLTQVGQAVACSRLHSTSERCARWLLMTNDRAGSDEFILTQEFLAYMLGVRRGSVTVALGPLRKAGLVSYSRGHLKVLDRDGLHEAACECYDIMREAFEGVFG